MDPLIAEASYWVVLFISPRITVSREPDSAPFRAEIMSWKDNERHSQRPPPLVWSGCEGPGFNWPRYLLCLPFISKSNLPPLSVGPLGQDIDDGLLIHTWDNNRKNRGVEIMSVFMLRCSFVPEIVQISGNILCWWFMVVSGRTSSVRHRSKSTCQSIWCGDGSSKRAEKMFYSLCIYILDYGRYGSIEADLTVSISVSVLSAALHCTGYCHCGKPLTVVSWWTVIKASLNTD